MVLTDKSRNSIRSHNQQTPHTAVLWESRRFSFCHRCRYFMLIQNTNARLCVCEVADSTPRDTTERQRNWTKSDFSNLFLFNVPPSWHTWAPVLRLGDWMWCECYKDQQALRRVALLIGLPQDILIWWLKVSVKLWEYQFNDFMKQVSPCVCEPVHWFVNIPYLAYSGGNRRQ